MYRDGGQCRHVDPHTGERCGETRRNQLTVHHVVWRSKGGNHTMENMLVLCQFHHDQLHPMWQKEIEMQPRELAQEQSAARDLPMVERSL